MITAAYTFIYLGITVFGTVRAHLKKSAVPISIRNVSFACALASLLSLERSMLSTFGDPTTAFALTAQACTGGAAFLILVGLGVSMLVMSGRTVPS